ncbi:MAG: DNA primase [Candidatus Acidulodesulfobacterium acidiphilum]|uniref:DNA primase n=1 Tax=Candidatus Acidulodesulfobacterium acidiphilum TaxID=2597224 RepID=A0A520XEU1_9DELT|nr:MAG: DNA primase [Candidatus Acidulodesulfobacterium acidiphilum]
MDKNIETVLSYVNIVEEISGFVKLKKTGRNYTGLCPFHSEKTPSFSVNETKGLYYCFGCGKGGNVITFLKEIRGDSFSDIVDYLKNKYNIPVEYTKFRKTDSSSQAENPVKKIINLAVNFYYENLFVYISNSRHIMNYLNERGINVDVAKDFKLGYAGFGNGLTALLKSVKADLDIAADMGLLVKKDDYNKVYADRFVNKLIIPIMDRTGEPIALASRIITRERDQLSNNFPKYINTNNSEIFVKNNTLYGLDKALPFIKKENAVIVVEGYFDMITLYANGIKNIVATMGTALSKNHISSLSRLCDEIVLLYDGDKAGINAINRGMELFREFMDSSDKNIYAACLSGGEDPDTYVRKFGSENLIKLINESKKPPVEFAIDYYVEKNKKSGIIKNNEESRLKSKISVIKDVVPYFKKIGNNIIFSHYVNILANKLGLNENVIRRYIESNKSWIGTGNTDYSLDTAYEISIKEDMGIEDIIVSKIFCNLVLTEYISDDIISEFSDKDAVYIIKEIQNAVKKGASQEIIKGAVEEIISGTVNADKWKRIYYSGLMSENSGNREDFKKLLMKLKVNNIDKICRDILEAIKSGNLDEKGKVIKFQELNRLKYISKEFQKKICGY